ncbi:MAG: VOC family protein [Chloroflexota bacterium]|nr:VOC family protein [Chloroflexota bacterium]
MRIHHLDLWTPDPAALRPFYAEVLQLPVLATTSAGTLSLQAGHTQLTFTQAPSDWQGRYHFAFNIAPSRFAEAKTWLAQRVPLLRDSTGADEFYSQSWNAHSLYFADPAGNILEWIARHTLPPDASGGPVIPATLGISEIGLAAPDVPQAVAAVQAQIGAPLYHGPGSATFSPVGDEDGLCIMVQEGRLWFPDTGIPADRSPITALVADANGLQRTVHWPPA